MLLNRSIFFSSFLTLSKLRPYQFDFQHCIVKNNFVCWYFCSDLLRNDWVSSWRNIYLSFVAINMGDIFVTNSGEGKRKIVSNVIFTSRGEKKQIYIRNGLGFRLNSISFPWILKWKRTDMKCVVHLFKIVEKCRECVKGRRDRERALFHIGCCSTTTPCVLNC